MERQPVDALGSLREREQYRQTRLTFDQRRIQDRRWFTLRLGLGWTAIALLPALSIISIWIIANASDFAISTVSVATTVLSIDTLGIVLSVWRIVIGQGPPPLQPLRAD